jgi:tetratricopeptide (TPR) repeat protein
MGVENPVAQARIYLGLNRPREAITLLGASLVLNPDDVESLQLLAQANLAADPGRDGASVALPLARRAIELNPQDAFAWRIAAVCYTRIGSHQQARDAARSARSIGPDQWVNHTAVAHADASGRTITDDTRASVAEAIRLASNHAETHFAAGHVAHAAKRNAEAAAHYERALAIQPDHPGARNNLGLIHMRRGNAGGAAATFTSMLAQNPNSDLALRNLRATGFNALRIVYFIIVLTLIVARGVAEDVDGRDTAIVVALIAVGCVVGYVLWIRRRAGIYFWRFVRGIPSTDKLLTVWAIVLALSLVGIVTAIFLTPSAADLCYLVVQFVLIISVVMVSIANSARRRRS